MLLARGHNTLSIIKPSGYPFYRTPTPHILGTFGFLRQESFLPWTDAEAGTNRLHGGAHAKRDPGFNL